MHASRCNDRGWCVTHVTHQHPQADQPWCSCHGFWEGPTCQVANNFHCYRNCRYGARAHASLHVRCASPKYIREVHCYLFLHAAELYMRVCGCLCGVPPATHAVSCLAHGSPCSLLQQRHCAGVPAQPATHPTDPLPACGCCCSLPANSDVGTCVEGWCHCKPGFWGHGCTRTKAYKSSVGELPAAPGWHSG